MKRLARATLAIAICLFIVAQAAQAQPYPPQAVPVHGYVMARANGSPAPGLTAFLIHPILGRSAPSFSDAQGHFGWMAIPMRPEPYYLEIYWGRNLIYRQPVTITAPLTIPTLLL